VCVNLTQVCVNLTQAQRLPASAAPVAGHPGARLFALQRLVDVTLYNAPRLPRLWPLLEAHVMDECITHASVCVWRRFGPLAFTGLKLVCLACGRSLRCT
jgi:hypothetical protein